MKSKLFLDSGAPSLYAKFAQHSKSGRMMGTHIKDRKYDRYDWLDDPEYLAYREHYARYIEKHEHETTIYTNLDIVNNAEATYENQKWFEARGLNPMPVWHFGSDPKWLKKYIDEGYEFLGIGGMVPNPFRVLKPSLDAIFRQYICDKSGYPTVKVHGFAATSIPLMVRYPWWSVDSSTWIKTAAYGQIVVPRMVNNEYQFLSLAHKVEVSLKSPRIKEKTHFFGLPKNVQEYIREWVKMCGLEFGQSHMENGEEVIDVPGVMNNYKQRANLNIHFYVGLQNALPKWPWKFEPVMAGTLI